MTRRQLDRLLVQIVRQPDHDRVGLGMRDRLFEVGGALRDPVLGGEGVSALLRARVDDLDAVAVPLTVQRRRVEQPDQARSQHRDSVVRHGCETTRSAGQRPKVASSTLLASFSSTLRRRRTDALDRASRICTDAIAAGGLAHAFGTGHSRIPVEELFPRYGSFPGFNPIVELSMTFHTQVVGANGQRQAMFIERIGGPR